MHSIIEIYLRVVVLLGDNWRPIRLDYDVFRLHVVYAVGSFMFACDKLLEQEEATPLMNPHHKTTRGNEIIME
jgi:hypothetical protein